VNGAVPRFDLRIVKRNSGRSLAFSRRRTPELCMKCPQKRGNRKRRVPSAPAAACAKVESTRVSHHGRTGITRRFLRNGFNGLFRALPGDRAFLPPSPPRSLLPENLTPASGRQDHTTSPSASAPFVRAKCLRCVLPRPSHPRPTSVTIAKRPSVWAGMADDVEVIWVKSEPEYFCEGDWTTQITLESLGKLSSGGIGNPRSGTRCLSDRAPRH
jgi:hypothetical protein